MSYKTFYKKVLGAQVVDRITNMNNTVLVVDEAHNITCNEYGDALTVVIKNSENLRILLLTATPMTNLADEIIDLLNCIQPENNKIQRDKLFSCDKKYNMKIKPNWIEYLKERAKCYIMYYRGSIQYTFASSIDKGSIPKGLLFTPVIFCYIEPFQKNVYTRAVQNVDDTLDKASSAASNFIFTAISKDKQSLIGNYSNDG